MAGAGPRYTTVVLDPDEEMRRLFPDCEIRRERFLGFTKAYVAVRAAPGLR